MYLGLGVAKDVCGDKDGDIVAVDGGHEVVVGCDKFC